MDASIKRVPGTEEVTLPTAPAEYVVHWQDLLLLAGEWMRRGGPLGPVTTEDARARARVLFQARFGRWPDQDGLSYVPGFEPSSISICERSRGRFRGYYAELSKVGDGQSESESASHAFDLDGFLASWEGSTGKVEAPDW